MAAPAIEVTAATPPDRQPPGGIRRPHSMRLPHGPPPAAPAGGKPPPPRPRASTLPAAPPQPRLSVELGTPQLEASGRTQPQRAASAQLQCAEEPRQREQSHHPPLDTSELRVGTGSTLVSEASSDPPGGGGAPDAAAPPPEAPGAPAPQRADSGWRAQSSVLYDVAEQPQRATSGWRAQSSFLFESEHGSRAQQNSGWRQSSALGRSDMELPPPQRQQTISSAGWRSRSSALFDDPEWEQHRGSAGLGRSESVSEGRANLPRTLTACGSGCGGPEPPQQPAAAEQDATQADCAALLEELRWERARSADLERALREAQRSAQPAPARPGEAEELAQLRGVVRTLVQDKQQLLDELAALRRAAPAALPSAAPAAPPLPAPSPQRAPPAPPAAARQARQQPPLPSPPAAWRRSRSAQPAAAAVVEGLAALLRDGARDPRAPLAGDVLGSIAGRPSRGPSPAASRARSPSYWSCSTAAVPCWRTAAAPPAYVLPATGVSL
eukprot:TRINITY_DN29006_c0_g1_i2.p1 TRINITY_DN29006_c0_g1~~TRINITY_DN29006_c0_g1_i2.p1  ORF type:complete len:535 (+),score=121.19 TRINITY_DN29006_c0_g1_i2:116-1606(+)